MVPIPKHVTPLLVMLLCVGCSTAAPGPGTKVASRNQPDPTSSSGGSTTPIASASATSSAPAAEANPGGLSDGLMVGQLFMAYVSGSSATAATSSQRNANLALSGAPTGAEVIRRWHLGGVRPLGWEVNWDAGCQTVRRAMSASSVASSFGRERNGE